MDEIVKLKPEVKERWLAALRSGDYAQGKNRLCTVDQEQSRVVYDTTVQDGDKLSYCCLGVLCDIAAEDGVGRWSDDDLQPTNQAGVMRRAFVIEGEGPALGVLPLGVIRWAFQNAPGGHHLRLSTPPVVRRGHPTAISLTVMNDDMSADFTEIADAIEYSL